VEVFDLALVAFQKESGSVAEGLHCDVELVVFHRFYIVLWLMFRQGLIFRRSHSNDAKDETADGKDKDDFHGIHYLASMNFLWASSFFAWASATITSRRWAEALYPSAIALSLRIVSFRSNLMFALTFMLLIYHTYTICQEPRSNFIAFKFH